MAKGYKPKRKQFKLEFDDAVKEDMEGCEVLAKRVSMAKMLEFQRLGALPGYEGFDEMIAIFATAIVAWNLEDDDDEPLPVTLENLMEQEGPFVTALMNSWQTTQAGVSAPLDGASSSGETSPDLQIPMIPMDDQSQSLAS